jgi:hypothetical protein
MSITTIEAHLVILAAIAANIAGTFLALATIRSLHTRLNGHLQQRAAQECLPGPGDQEPPVPSA